MADSATTSSAIPNSSDPPSTKSSFYLDAEGLTVIGDGLQFIATLKALYEEWTEAGRPTSTSPSVPASESQTTPGIEWDAGVVDIFLNGVSCDCVVFPADDPSERQIWYMVYINPR